METMTVQKKDPRAMWETQSNKPEIAKEHKRSFTELLLGAFVISIPLAVFLFLGIKSFAAWLVEIEFDELMVKITTDHQVLSSLIIIAILVGTVSIVVRSNKD